MNFKALVVSSSISVFAMLAIACGGNSDANKANIDMSSPSHDNMSPTVDGGSMMNQTNSDLAAPAKVNESPAPTK